MTRNMTFGAKHLPAVLAVTSGALVALSAQAQESSYDFKLFGGAAYVTPLSDSSLAVVASSVEASSEYGWELGGEWKASDRFGVELAYLDAKHDVEADRTPIGEISLRPWNLTSEIELNAGTSLAVDSETTYGVSTGLDLGLGDTFAIQLGLRWLEGSVDAPALPDDVSVDPLFMRVGVALRF